MRKIVPEKVRDAIRERIDGLMDGVTGQMHAPAQDKDVPGPAASIGNDRDSAAIKPPERQPEPDPDPEAAMRRVRTKALIRHARAADAIFQARHRGLEPTDDQLRELGAARRVFDEVRPYGWQDAEAAYNKDNSLAHDAAKSNTARAIRALYLETELRTDPQLRADRFVERWQKLSRASERQYANGDRSAYQSTRSAMADMARSLERDPQMESLLANRKRELGIGMGMETGRRLGDELAFSHGLGRGRGRGIEM